MHQRHKLAAREGEPAEHASEYNNNADYFYHRKELAKASSKGFAKQPFYLSEVVRETIAS
ncbi:hypothetical protein FQZ97_851560 [compost metagenome]